jgi:predicted ABC-type ATPase
LTVDEKKLYIIGGCNGAGKTTASFNILPELLNCKEFVNADEIARGLSPFQPEKVSIEAGRLMLTRIDELIQSNQDFSFETTLSTRSFIHTINRAKSSGYFVTLIFFWLESVELAKDRVKKRVSEGGHHIEEEVIKRRYKLGIDNLFNLYADKVDSLFIFDNSALESDLIAEKKLNGEFNVYQLDKYNKLKLIADER